MGSLNRHGGPCGTRRSEHRTALAWGVREGEQAGRVPPRGEIKLSGGGRAWGVTICPGIGMGHSKDLQPRYRSFCPRRASFMGVRKRGGTWGLARVGGGGVTAPPSFCVGLSVTALSLPAGPRSRPRIPS